MASSSAPTKEFFELVKAIGEAKSKQEEDKIILKEIEVLNGIMGEKGVAPRRMKEYLVRVMYVMDSLLDAAVYTPERWYMYV